MARSALICEFCGHRMDVDVPGPKKHLHTHCYAQRKEDAYYFCTRFKGHEGKHVACGVAVHVHDEWEEGE